MLETTAVRSWNCRSFYGMAGPFPEVSLLRRIYARLGELFTLIHRAIERCASGYFVVMESILLQKSIQGGVSERVPVVGDGICKIQEGGKAMKKTLLALVLLLAVTGIVGFIGVLDVSAATSDNAYVVVKCTMNVSVDVVDTTNYVFVNSRTGVGPDEIWVSSYVSVRNDGAGSITHWSLRISSQNISTDNYATWTDTTTSYIGWTYGTNLTDNAVNKIVLAAVFAQEYSITAANFAANDLLSQSDQVYGQTNGVFGPAGPATAYATDFSPSTNNMVSYTGVNTRRLFFYVRTPQVFTDELPRRFTIMVTAASGL